MTNVSLRAIFLTPIFFKNRKKGIRFWIFDKISSQQLLLEICFKSERLKIESESWRLSYNMKISPWNIDDIKSLLNSSIFRMNVSVPAQVTVKMAVKMVMSSRRKKFGNAWAKTVLKAKNLQNYDVRKFQKLTLTRLKHQLKMTQKKRIRSLTRKDWILQVKIKFLVFF